MARNKTSTLNDALFSAIDEGNKTAVAKLLAAGADAKACCRDEDENTTLTRALNEEIEKASAPVVELLLRAGADPNLPSGAGYAPICCAAEYAAPKITELLLRSGAKVDTVDPLRRTALMVAAVRGHVAVMKVLIAAGADVNFQMDDDDGNTVLTKALDPNEIVTKPAVKVVQTLLEAGADPNRPNKDGWTPLHYAASFPDPKLIDLLVAAGADVKATRATHVYAVDVADLQGHQSVVKRLIAHGSPTVVESATQQIQATWRRIDAWWKNHAPACSDLLAAAQGTKPAAMAKLERTLKVKLPADFRAHLALYGGSGRVSFYEYDGMSVARISSRWTGLDKLYQAGTWKKAAPYELDKNRREIQWAWWHPGWIPFAEDGGGNLYCLDLDPEQNGRRGQVIKWEMHGGPVGPVAPSFDVFLDRYLKAMEAGELEYDDGSLSRK